MYGFIFIFLVSLAVTFLSVPWLIPKLVKAGLTGRDVNKQGKPEVAEMGGFGIIFGFAFGVLLAVGSQSFDSMLPPLDLTLILAALSTILLMSLVGIFDDLFAMNQLVKATLPLVAALPLVAVEAGTSTMVIPFVGSVHFGVLYALLLVPAGIAGASNVTNMLAGFNGLESGMGFVACAALSAIAFALGKYEALVLLLAMAGALLAFMYFSWYPARVFIGDIGTLSIGAVIAASVIVGDFEAAGLILIIPYAFDFFIKAWNGFPSTKWWGELSGGKLLCLDRPVGLAQWVMKLSGGMSEQRLVASLVVLEAVFGVIAIVLFVR